MDFNQLKQDDFDLIKQVYATSETRKTAQKQLSKHYDVSKRTIRNWAKKINVGVMTKNVVNDSKIMIYDIETSRVPAMVWWTGKQFVSHRQLQGEPKIITISWKWLGSDEVHSLAWDDNHCDKKMVGEFMKEYNKADLVIGQNNNNFDNRWVQARAAKFGFEVNTFIRSFDIMKESKKRFRLVSYSMEYMCQYFDVAQKLSNEGIKMWDKIQLGTPDEQAEYLPKMIEYNVGDIIATEALYYRLRPYFGHQTHIGVLNGGEKYSCPSCGGTDVSLYKTTVTAAGTIQRVMICNEDGVKFKISNRSYMDFIKNKINQINE